MRYDKIKKVLVIIILTLVSFLVLLGLIAGSIFGYYSFNEYNKEKAVDKQFTLYQDSVYSYIFESYKSSGIVRLKVNNKNRCISYDCSLIADTGYVITNTDGFYTVVLNDKDGFKIDEFKPSAYVSIKDKNDYIVGMQTNGQIYMNIDDLLRVKSVSVSNSLTFASRKKDKLVVKKSAFDLEIDEWTNKSNLIKTGMTYEEMVAAAGQPRTISSLATDDYGYGYDFKKYNYGKKWVYFKSKLVFEIK